MTATPATGRPIRSHASAITACSDSPVSRTSLRLESLRDLVAVQPRHLLLGEVLAHVLRQIAARHARLLERARADREVTDQLDMHDPAPPDLPDQPLTDVAADREVHVQPMTAGMPLRRPRIRDRLAAQLATEAAKELAHVGPQLPGITAALRRRSESRTG